METWVPYTHTHIVHISSATWPVAPIRWKWNLPSRLALRTIFAGWDCYLSSPLSWGPLLLAFSSSILSSPAQHHHIAVLVSHGQVANSHAFNCFKQCRAWSWDSCGWSSSLEHTGPQLIRSCPMALIYSTEFFPRMGQVVRFGAEFHCLQLWDWGLIFLTTWRPYSEATCNSFSQCCYSHMNYHGSRPAELIFLCSTSP